MVSHTKALLLPPKPIVSNAHTNLPIPPSVELPYVPGWFEAVLVWLCHTAWFSAIDNAITYAFDQLVQHPFEHEDQVQEELMESGLSSLWWCGELWKCYIYVVVWTLWPLYLFEILVHMGPAWVLGHGLYPPVVSLLVTLNLWAYLGVVGWVLVWTWWVDRKGTCAERMGL